MKDERIKVTEVMIYKTHKTDRPVIVHGKIYIGCSPECAHHLTDHRPTLTFL